MTGALILNADPSVALGAATKQYVDTTDALKVNKAGDTMTGPLSHNSTALFMLLVTRQRLDTIPEQVGLSLKAQEPRQTLLRLIVLLELSLPITQTSPPLPLSHLT